ncbi:MAG: bifunctional demethylmenaquinone methyltransferase/2-methoxy-6-polyprenyl-1,4-benzoquinol methylase UbiE [Candidatus Cryptobacteroides sp.]
MPKKEGIQDLFDSIAPEYDRLNHILSLDIDKTWRKRAVKRIVDARTPLNILDIACGTGDFAIATAKKCPEGSRITGIDISSGMLEIGKNKVKKEGLENFITLETGDCAEIAYADATFDRVTIAFGIRNFEDKEKCLMETFRVLKPGGKIVIVELSVPSNKLLFRLYGLYFKRIIPAVGGMVSGNKGAYKYLPESVIRFPKPEVFMKMMSDAGYTRIRHKSFTLSTCRMFIGVKPQKR